MQEAQEKQIAIVDGAGNVHVIVLTESMDVELKHRLLGQVLRRIRDFSTKYDADGDPRIVAREVELDFASSGGKYLILTAVRDLEVVGHLLARAIDYFGHRYIYVQQMELDERSGVTLAQERGAFKAIQAWQRGIGARGIRAVAPTPAHVRRLRMLHGGQAILTTMKFGEDTYG